MPAVTLAELPESFIENVCQVCGGRGETWLRKLPELIEWLQDSWKIEVAPAFPNLSYNYVAPAAKKSGEQVVLKLGLPVDDGEFEGEIAYLRYINGEGAVRLIKEEPDLRALLLERILPGHDLRKAYPSNPAAAVDAAIGLLRRLKKTPPRASPDFILLEDWATKLGDAEHWDFPKDYALRALKTFQAAKGDDRSLLHGDFHHENILYCDRTGFLAIDPKGVIGDIKYDIAVFLNNHRGWLEAAPYASEQLDSAVRRFADAFSIAAGEIRQWAFAQKVLSAFWTRTENGGRWRDQLTSADFWGI